MNETVREVLLGLKKLKGSSQIFSSTHRELFERVLERAKIQDASFHTLRHTAASWLVMSGADLLTVSRLLGHSDVKMTMRYAHLSSDHIAGAVGRLDTAWTPKRVLDDSAEGMFWPQLVDVQHDAEVAKLADAQDLKS